MSTTKEIDRHLEKDPDTGIYQAKFKDLGGKTQRRSTKTKNLAEARRVVDQSRLIELELAAKANSLNAESLTAIMAGRKVTCEDALLEWKAWRTTNAAGNTVRTQDIVLRQFLNSIEAGKWPVAKLTYEHLDGFVNSKDPFLSRATCDMRLACLKSFFDFVTARAYCVGNPASLVRVRLKNLSHEQKERKPRVPFTEREYNHLVENTEGMWRWWVELSYWAGLRLGDCATLEWASLLPEEIVVWTGKHSERVALPIDDPLIGGGRLRTVFMEMMEHNRHPQYVFPQEREVALDPEKRAKHSVYFGRILAELGIEGKSFHCLRHSFATRLDAAGKTVEEIGRLIGHSASSAKVTAGYIHRDKK